MITGDKTQMDWPAAMKFNPDNGDLYVANDIGGSVLVFANAAKRAGRRSAGPSDQRTVDATAKSHRGGSRQEESRAMGVQPGELFRHACIR